MTKSFTPLIVNFMLLAFLRYPLIIAIAVANFLIGIGVLVLLSSLRDKKSSVLRHFLWVFECVYALDSVF
ncbi:MAG: hypothetical protein CK532_05685 [Flavobacteriales bacterium]|nr:MAG: hypothetical protein CK532_05685 [Flavobacteriales bacterium]